jgi:hypothetical protein
MSTPLPLQVGSSFGVVFGVGIGVVVTIIVTVVLVTVAMAILIVAMAAITTTRRQHDGQYVRAGSAGSTEVAIAILVIFRRCTMEDLSARSRFAMPRQVP